MIEESNPRQKEASNTRIQPYHDLIYQQGDEVVYMNTDNKWDGPGKLYRMINEWPLILQFGYPINIIMREQMRSSPIYLKLKHHTQHWEECSLLPPKITSII